VTARPPASEPAPLSTRAAHALLQLTVLLWGLTALLGKSISVGARVLVFYRVLVVAVIMAVLMKKQNLGFSVPRRTFAELVGAGTCVALHWITFYATIKLAGIVVAVTCLSATTFFTALLEPWVFARRIRVHELLLGGGTIMGVAVLLRVEAERPSAGIALGLVSAFFSAAFGTWNGRIGKAERGEKVTFYELSTALVVTGLTFFLKGGFVPPWQLKPIDIVLLLVLAVFCTTLPWLWSLRVLRTLSPFTVSLSVSLEPVYSLVLAYLLFPTEERTGPRFYLGASLLGGLVLLHAWMKRREPPTPSDEATHEEAARGTASRP